MLEDRILRLPDVIKMTGISRSRIYVKMYLDEDPFPLPVVLGPNTRGWWLSEVQEWMRNRPRANSQRPVGRCAQ